MTNLFKKICEQRGITEDFLSPKYENLSDPFLMVDMDRAIERIKKAVDNQEKVLIYGDYDVDGVTATTIVYRALKMAGLENVVTMLPNRFTDGYGMSKKLIEAAREQEINLVITVDCGSNNGEIIDELNQIGIDVIVSDHHEFSGEVPKAVAVVNPKRSETDVVLAGAGVAFTIARAMVEKGLIRKGQEKWLLDLAAIGTICDSMTLRGDNRIICYYGFIVLEKTNWLGLKELSRIAGISKIDSESIGFGIGPRINAAGRMESADIALNLLMTNSRTEAAKLALKLQELNDNRKFQQNTAVGEVAEKGVGDEPVLVIEGNWHEGIVGIIAGRLTETYKRPAFVLSKMENGDYKGSGRSFGDFNLSKALNECRDLLVSGGGHAAAAGLRVMAGKLDEFKGRINDYYKSLKLVDQEKYLLVNEDVEVDDFNELNLKLVDDLKKLEPFGEGNLEPVFLLKEMLVTGVQKMGEKQNHIKLTLADSDGNLFKVVKFYADEETLAIPAGERINAWVTLRVNEWGNKKDVEGMLVRVSL